MWLLVLANRLRYNILSLETWLTELILESMLRTFHKQAQRNSSYKAIRHSELVLRYFRFALKKNCLASRSILPQSEFNLNHAVIGRRFQLLTDRVPS